MWYADKSDGDGEALYLRRVYVAQMTDLLVSSREALSS